MDITFYQVCIIEVTAFIIGILLILKGLMVLKSEKAEKYLGFMLIVFGFCFSTQTLSSDGYTVRYIASIFDPCLKNSFSFECLDQELKLTIKKNNEHRSGE
ncbi:hypothetical protein IFR35_10500 [Pseudomonas fluorescens]|uniref:hypothetical protein n=1 Tax=Pseudomonas fluorescens TaxID=294 RepID=UPI00177DA865|nr:hypothetical protein [Pseudomonas fluorescens]MBD8192301.1 hypothetical protein [Pseudomonas fluorescens]MBD8226925.1 hypothetical protein [Pseudomonas fluorescens]MBD8784638.1 hypothetical protein [Pseudomonas fluorescens]MBD8817318.1 hypothetical protein [Pseudomonas fluorescens]